MVSKEHLHDLPSVNAVLTHPAVSGLVATHGRPVVVHAAQVALGDARTRAQKTGTCDELGSICRGVADLVGTICGGSLRKVVNATGIVLNTNLGRAPLGRETADDIAQVVAGYTSLELDLDSGRRGSRGIHAAPLLCYLTSAESVAIVNNNAAAIMLVLNTLARDREVVVSRGELIEIGGSFRIPEIMAASGARMREAGTTNRTHLSDYEAAITADTAVLFKAHRSNFSIVGFTEEVSAPEVAELAHKHGLLMVYDVGSGLLRQLDRLPFPDEPDVQGALAGGADLVTFSCDKMLGGPQAGVVAGRADLVSRLVTAPMMRALRVGKLTLAGLASVSRQWLDEDDLLASNPALSMLARDGGELKRLASRLCRELRMKGIAAELTESLGQGGGGSLPGVQFESVAVEVVPQAAIGDPKQTFAERIHRRLLEADPPVLGVLREGRLLLDVLALFEAEITHVARAVADSIRAEGGP